MCSGGPGWEGDPSIEGDLQCDQHKPSHSTAQASLQHHGDCRVVEHQAILQDAGVSAEHQATLRDVGVYADNQATLQEVGVSAGGPMSPVDEVCAIVSIYADDSKAGGVVRNIEEQVRLQASLDRLHKWSVDWQLLFNTAKCKIMHLGPGN